MNHSIEEWKKIEPRVLVTPGNGREAYYMLLSAQEDIAELAKQNREMKDLLKTIAYPRCNTPEECADIYEAANRIQKVFTLEQLED